MKRTVMIFATLVLLATGTALAQNRRLGPPPGAQRGGPEMRHGPGPMMDVLVEFLGLTDDQKAQWQSFHEATRATVEPLVEQRRSVQEQIHSALEGDTPDTATVGALVIQGYEIGEQIRAAHEKLQADLKVILTPDQQLKFDAFRAAQKAFGRGPGGPGPGRGGPDGPGF